MIARVFPAPSPRSAIPGTTKPIMISGIQKLMKLPKILLYVAPSSMIIGKFTALAMLPTTIPNTIAIISLGCNCIPITAFPP